MLAFLRRKGTTLLIDRGRVGCPERGADVELDVCCACEKRVEIDERAPLPYVQCEPSPGFRFRFAEWPGKGFF